jgi:hypothetical protein
MPCAHSGRGLMLAGLILSLIGLGIVMVRTLQIPGYWIPLGVGVAMMLFGAVRRGHPGGT